MYPVSSPCGLLHDIYISDHFPVFTFFQLTKHVQSSHFSSNLKLSREKLNNIKSDLNSSDWSTVFNTDNANVSFNNYAHL